MILSCIYAAVSEGVDVEHAGADQVVMLHLQLGGISLQDEGLVH